MDDTDDDTDDNSDSDSEDDSNEIDFLQAPGAEFHINNDDQNTIILLLKKTPLLLMRYFDVHREARQRPQISSVKDYDADQVLLGHLFALQSWIVIDYIIQSTTYFKYSLDYDVKCLDKKSRSILTILFEENITLFDALITQAYFKKELIKDLNVLQSVNDRLAIINGTKKEKSLTSLAKDSSHAKLSVFWEEKISNDQGVSTNKPFKFPSVFGP